MAQQARADEDLRLQDLDHQWVNDHQLRQHASTTLEKGPHKAFQVKTCSKLGTCVCRGDGKQKAAMLYKLTAHIKAQHPGTQKAPSVERTQFTEGLCVLEIAPQTREEEGLYQDCCHAPLGVDQRSPIIYLHVGATNMKTWEMTCTRLQCCFFNPFSNMLTLEITEDTPGPEVRTCLDMLKHHCDISLPYSVRCLKIVTDRNMDLLEDSMLPKFVDVQLHEGVRSEWKCFWRGADAEFAPKISKHRKKEERKEPGGDGCGRQPRSKASGSAPARTRTRTRTATTSQIPTDQQQGQQEQDLGDDGSDDDNIIMENAGGSDSESGLHHSTDVDAILRALCPDEPEPEEIEQNNDEEINEGDQDDQGQFLQLIDDLIAHHYPQEDPSPDSDSDADAPAPVHPSELLAGAGPGPGDGDASSGKKESGKSSSSSSSSSTSSSSSSSSEERRRRQRRRKRPREQESQPKPAQTIAAAGAQSSSVFDPSTVEIGPFRLVKRFHPATWVDLVLLFPYFT